MRCRGEFSHELDGTAKARHARLAADAVEDQGNGAKQLDGVHPRCMYKLAVILKRSQSVRGVSCDWLVYAV